MTTLLTGVMLVTGQHGVGKTRFALESGDPTKTILIDDDEKGRAEVERVKKDLAEHEIEIGRYVDFVSKTRGKKMLGIHDAGLQIIDDIEPDKYEVLIWDTWSRFAETCATYVQTHNNEFRDRWAAMGKIKGGEEYKEARYYEAELIHRLQEKVPLVILISHLKNQYLNNAQTGKQIPAVGKAVDKVCNLRLWIKRNPASTTPIALVLKNISKNILVDGHLRTIQVLPTKITPLNTEECFEQSLWDSIERYFENPIGNRKPTKDEIPDDFEMSIVHGTLTEDQRLSWLYSLKERKQEEELEKIMLYNQNKKRAGELKEAGKPLSEIAKELQVPMNEVLEMLGLA
jgi:hypothetical protein